MKDRKKRNITIISLCCLLVFMGIGYAILLQTLNIDGTASLTGKWNVYIETITEITEGKTTAGKSISAVVTGEEKTGDYVKYKVIVKNGGNISASLRDIETSSNVSIPDIKFSHTATLGKVIKP